MHMSTCVCKNNYGVKQIDSFDSSIKDIILSVGFLVWGSVVEKRPQWEASAKEDLAAQGHGRRRETGKGTKSQNALQRHAHSILASSC